MTSFNSLFGRFFVKKAKNAYSLLILQVIGALAFSVCGLLIGTGGFYEFLNLYTELLPDWLMGFLILSFFCIIYFFIYMAVKNERLSHNQTWRLAATSDSKFYLANSLSSFVTFIYFIVLDIIVAGILFYFSYQIDQNFKSSWQKMIKQLNPAFDVNTVHFIINIIILVMLCCFFLSLLISFLNFASKAIMDYLPSFSSRLLVSFFHLIIVIIIAMLFARMEMFFANQIMGNILNLLNFKPAYDSNLLYANIIISIVNLILLGVNIFLFDYFYEADEKSR
ncbi:hypothetical protein JF73_08690 [Lactobacillus helsingborgensis]|uniref:Uncharacterized protein n=1 Tax=Lactobacillus helsingborgensis TaxID=1218494 RepID=A0AA47B2N0_9LACO|nr:hypothetical protein [Lactobacillus helsingborgensis]KJY64871.1 hypothetical protein JF73_08690 [Lactobacillus helsingborgensis]UZX28879.1 hypothetical protein LDX53_04610 [Lactobacillus helsingborgensis]